MQRLINSKCNVVYIHQEKLGILIDDLNATWNCIMTCHNYQVLSALGQKIYLYCLK